MASKEYQKFRDYKYGDSFDIDQPIKPIPHRYTTGERVLITLCIFGYFATIAIAAAFLSL